MMSKRKTPSFILELPLVVNQEQECILLARLEAPKNLEILGLSTNPAQKRKACNAAQRFCADSQPPRAVCSVTLTSLSQSRYSAAIGLR